MIAVLDLPADLTDLEFDIPCEFPGCDEPAAVMAKGCADPVHVATCGRCLAKLEGDFEACKPATCSICYRPFMHFSTHYDLAEIR